MITTDLLVFIPAYSYSEELDNHQLISLQSQTCLDFQLLFIDPHNLVSRKEKVHTFEKETGIKSFYFPYSVDSSRRKWDWAIMNVPFLISEKGRVLRYQQNRIINSTLIEATKNAGNSNIGYLRGIVSGDILFPLEASGNIEFEFHSEKRHVPYDMATFCFKYGGYETNIEDDPGASYGDWCINVDQFLKVNGIDEAITAAYHFEDIDFNMRWKIAKELGIVSVFTLLSNMMIWFHGRSRKKSCSTKRSQYPDDKCDICDGEIKQNGKVPLEQTSDYQINTAKLNKVEGYNYLGYINGKEWFQCGECGLIFPRLGHPHFSAFQDNIISKKIYKASIGIAGKYGRNLMRIRQDVLKSKNWEEAVSIINNSWQNPKYFCE